MARDATPSRWPRCSDRVAAASRTSSTARARRSGLARPVGLAGLDALEEQAVEQARGSRGRTRRRRARRELAAGDALVQQHRRRRRPAARGGGRASRGRSGSSRPRPRPGRGRPGPARPRTRRSSRRSRRARGLQLVGRRGQRREADGELIEALPGDQVAALEEQRVLAREVRVDRADGQARARGRRPRSSRGGSPSRRTPRPRP